MSLHSQKETPARMVLPAGAKVDGSVVTTTPVMNRRDPFNLSHIVSPRFFWSMP
jgi:hypothetical protein